MYELSDSVVTVLTSRVSVLNLIVRLDVLGLRNYWSILIDYWLVVMNYWLVLMHYVLVLGREVWAWLLVGLDVDGGRLLTIKLGLSVLKHVHLLCPPPDVAGHYAVANGQDNENSTANPLGIHETPTCIIFKRFEITVLKISTSTVVRTAAVGEGPAITFNGLIGEVVAARLMDGTIHEDDQESEDEHYKAEDHG